MAVFDEEWQKARSAITERGIFMFNNELLSDVSLVVRSSTGEDASKKNKMAIPAHKLVLSICSPVFFAMFCGQMAEKSDSVDLPDCEYEGVLEMLRYMYSEEAQLSESNVMQVLYAAKKYILPSLAEECIEFLRKNLNSENVFSVMSHAQQYDEKGLMDQYWEMVDRKTEEAVKSDGFMTIQRSMLEELVKRDSLTVREIELFKAVNLWATKECERQGLATDGNTKRRILGEKIVKAIRFPVMEEKEFADVVLGCEILTSKEGIDIIRYFNSVIDLPMGFPEKERVGTVFLCSRFETVIVQDEDDCSIYIWGCNSDKKECIDFVVNRTISLHGIRLFGEANSKYVVILKVTRTHFPNSVVALSSGTFTSVPLHFRSFSYYGFDVMFDSPVFLKSGEQYCIGAIIEGPDSSYYGLDGLSIVECSGVTFQFLPCKQKNCGATSVDEGQFAAFLFCPTY